MKQILAVAFLAVGASPAWATETVETKGALEAVTVYRGQALVTRVLDVPGPAGLREVVATDLPEQIVPGSIYAESADGAEVRSVRYRVRPVSQDVREEVRKLDEQARQLGDQLQAVQRRKGLLDEHKAYLDKLEQFVAPTATLELTKGVLNAETLKTLTSYQMEQRKALAEEGLKLGLEERTLNEKLELLNRERQVISGSSSRTAREAIVFLNVPNAGGGKVRLRYLVNDATWMPSYNVRTDADHKQITVEYYASIQQMSGEDWADVAMTLSTATPSLIAKAPALVPLTVALAPAAAPPAQTADGRSGGKDFRSADYASTRDELTNKLKQVENERAQLRVQNQSVQSQRPAPSGEQSSNGVFMIQTETAATASMDSALNDLGCDLQMLDLVNRGKVVRKHEPNAPPADRQSLCVTYQLAARTTLPSRADQQLVQIAALPMKAQFYKVATPLLTDYIYEEAGVTNTSSFVLLAGPVSTYVAGQFVGHGEIPTVSSGESFTIGLGIDPSLRTVRELVDRTESVQGGNRVAEFTYRLSVENFATTPVKVRLIDRLPAGKESEVKITMVSSSVEVSGDAAYQQNERKKGLLRWEVEVPAQAVGMQAKALEYKFRIEHDKGMTVAGLPVAAK